MPPLKKYVTFLSPEDTSLWKATKGFKRPQVSIPPVRTLDGSWSKSDTEKATDFGHYLRKVFTPQSSFHPYDFVVSDFLDLPCPMSLPISPLHLGSVSSDCVPQCAQGARLRPHDGEDAPRTTTHGCRLPYHPLQQHASPLLLPTPVEICTNHNGPKTWQTGP